MKILTVVGNRPQFIKLAPLAKKLVDVADHIVVHTGQHFDYEMSGMFFDKLGLPEPHYNLGLHGSPEGDVVGRMVGGLEGVLLRERPDFVVVYGDTNSTLAGALAAAFAKIPLAHVESGARSFRLEMPEERNRRVTDLLSQICFCVTPSHMENLKREASTAACFVSGDLMLDSCLFWRDHGLAEGDSWRGANQIGDDFSIITIHRAENLGSSVKLRAIFEALADYPGKIIFPVHPHTRVVMQNFGVNPPANIIPVSPVGYFEMLGLVQRAKVIFTDSGGLQREAYFLDRPCLVLRAETEWSETLSEGRNQLVGADTEVIRRGISELAQDVARSDRALSDLTLFGGGLAAENIRNVILSAVQSG